MSEEKSGIDGDQIEHKFEEGAEENDHQSDEPHWVKTVPGVQANVLLENKKTRKNKHNIYSFLFEIIDMRDMTLKYKKL